MAPTAVVVGAVTMGPRSSIWYGAVARADAEMIEIGEGSNVQDGSTLHTDPGSPLVIGRGVTVGPQRGAARRPGRRRRAGRHGQHVHERRAHRLRVDRRRRRRRHAGQEIPPNSVVAGVPAKVVRETTEDDLAHIQGNAASYTERLPAARKVRPVVRRPLPPAGLVPDDGML